jgi:putative PIN family toxin of toxin-antitoxin system
MLKVVIDTSSLISYALTKGEIMVKIMEAWEREELQLILSSKTQAELMEVLDRPKIKSRSGHTRDWLLGRIEMYAVFVKGVVAATGVCRDPKDDKFLACAARGQAHYLVSSDKDLLGLDQYEGVCILNPGQFLIALRLAKMTAVEMKTTFSQQALTAIQENVCLEPETAVKLATARI